MIDLDTNHLIIESYFMKTFEVTLSERRSITRTIEAKCKTDAEQMLIDDHNDGSLDFSYYDNLECEAKETKY